MSTKTPKKRSGPGGPTKPHAERIKDGRRIVYVYLSPLAGEALDVLVKRFGSITKAVGSAIVLTARALGGDK